MCYDTVDNKNASSLILLARLTGSGVHELEGHVSDELSSQSAAVDLHPQRVRDDDTHGVWGALAFCNHGGRGEVHVVVLQTTQPRLKHSLQQRMLSIKLGYACQLHPGSVCTDILLLNPKKKIWHSKRARVFRNRPDLFLIIVQPPNSKLWQLLMLVGYFCCIFPVVRELYCREEKMKFLLKEQRFRLSFGCEWLRPKD